MVCFLFLFSLYVVSGGKDSKDMAPVKSKATPPSKKFKGTEVEKLTSPEKVSYSYGWCQSNFSC